MKKFLLILIVFLAAVLFWWQFFQKKDKGPKTPKPAPVALKKHSDAFNKSIDEVVNSYLKIKDAFVEADTAAAKAATAGFLESLNRIPMSELNEDTSVVVETIKANADDIRSNAKSLLQQTTITEMRRDFSQVTEVMYPSFFTAINYEGPTLYYTNCPMAFNETESANWISNSDEIVNPYLGKHDPKYKAGMLHCGEVKDSIKAK